MRPGNALFNRRIRQRLRYLSTSVVGSAKIKLLFFFCIVFSLFLVAKRAASGMSWRHRQSLPPVSSSPHLGKGYTILINTWKRYDLLKQSIVHYAFCAGVDSIHIVWSEPDPPSESLHDVLWRATHSNSQGRKEIDLVFDLNHEDSLNNRFKEIKDLRTDALFSIDDDVIFPCASVELAFSVWRSAPTTMVGFVPRMHWLDESRDDMEKYKYGGWWSVWWIGSYSMVLSKAAFFHRKYLAMYTNNLPKSIRDYVTNNRNCEDIAMSFLVANQTGAPPIWVKGRISEIGSTGISSLGGHSNRRTRCLNVFTALYGRMPLVPSNVKAIDSRSSWLW